MSVVIYFLYVICVCVFVTAVTMVVVHLYLRAESKPVTAMPAWVIETARYNSLLYFNQTFYGLFSMQEQQLHPYE